MLLSEELEIKTNMVSVLEEMALIEDYFLEEFGICLSETEELLEGKFLDKLKYDVLGVGGSRSLTKNADGKFEKKGIAGLINKGRRLVGGQGSKAGLYTGKQFSDMAADEERTKLGKIGVRGKELENRVDAAVKDARRRVKSEANVAANKRNVRDARAELRGAKRAYKDANRAYNPNSGESVQAFRDASEARATAKHNLGVARDELGAANRQRRTVREVTGQ